MTKLEEKVQNTNERWQLRDRIIVGAAGSMAAVSAISHVQTALGVDQYITRVLIDLPFGFIGAYAGLNCDRITNYFRNRRR